MSVKVGRPRRSWPALVALAVVCVLATPVAAHAASDHASASTTGKGGELRKTVPITRGLGAAPRVVLSLGPGKLGGIARGGRLELSSEVQLTVDCDRRSRRCAGRPYRYDPQLTVTLELGPRRGNAGGRVLARRTLTCRQHLPNRQHHCPVVFDKAMPVGRHFPCRLDHCFANVIVSASNPRAHRDDLIIIGANKPSGRIVQNKSRLNAVVLGRAAHGRRLATHHLRKRSLRLRPQRKVLLSQKVEGLQRGDVIAAAAGLRSDVRHLGYSALVGAELVVARGPNATDPSRLIRHSVSQNGLISPVNGTNCTPVNSPCLTRKVGVATIRRDLRGGSGGPLPLFVNLVIRTKQKRVGRQHGDRLRLRGGRLEAVVGSNSCETTTRPRPWRPRASSTPTTRRARP
jgi:hypothetical protein